MIRSLNTGVQGVRQYQTSLDAIGNNLANINTVAYKSARIDFSDTLNQTLRAPTPDTATNSGTSGMQVGNGLAISAIKNSYEQGAIKQTGVRTDLAVAGNGFFLVKDPTTNELFATRAGDFRLDKNSYLVTNGGFRVQGLNKQAPAYTVAEKKEIGDLQLDAGKYMNDVTGISIDVAGTAQRDTITVTTGNATTDTFTVTANGNATTAVNSVLDVAQVDTVTIAGDATTTADTFTITINGTAIGPTSWDTNNGTTAIAIAAAINANGVVNTAVTATTSGDDVIITSDTAGTAVTVTTVVADGGGVAPTATKVATTANVDGDAETATAIATATSLLAGVTAAASGNVVTITADSSGTAFNGDTNVALANADGTNDQTATVANLTANVPSDILTKASHGFTTGQQVKFASTTGAPTANPAITASTVLYVRVDPNDDGKLTLHSTASDAAAGTNSVDFTTATGTWDLTGGASISSFNVGVDGKVNMLLTDGTQYSRAQVRMQDFANKQNLMKQGANLYSNLATAGALGTTGTSASATEILSGAESPGNSGLGRIESGALELSNVDMAKEFAKMITTQRAFQANARVITTSDEILQEMMQLKR